MHSTLQAADVLPFTYVHNSMDTYVCPRSLTLGCVVKQAVPFCGGHRIHNADEHGAIARSAISVNFSLLTGHVSDARYVGIRIDRVSSSSNP